MNRLDRRIRILRGKRNGAFDPDQYYLEQADRARASRKIRAHLRRMQPVVLVTPRWSQAHRFLDDIAIDLQIGKPAIECRSLSLVPMNGRSAYESWTWLVRALVEFSGLPVDGPVSQAVDRHGFRHVMTELLRRSVRGPRRALLVHGLDHLHVEARDDLLRVFDEHVEEAGEERRLNLLLAGSVEMPHFGCAGAARLELPDFSTVEAVENLVEWVGVEDAASVRAAVQVVGGVPALLDALGAAGEDHGRVRSERDALWRALGPLADEIRGVVSIVSSDSRLADRLEQVAREGAQPEEPERDGPLVRAGLLQGQRGQVQLRAPLFAELALSGP